MRSSSKGHIPVWKRRSLRAALLLPAGVGLLYLAFRQVELGSLLASLSRANYWPIAGAMLVGAASHLVRALRWQIQLRELSPRISVWQVFYAVMLGYTVNLAIPRAGEVARCGQIASSQSIALDRTIGTMLGERMADMLVSLLLFAVAIVASYSHFGQFVADAVGRGANQISLQHLPVLLAVLVGTIGLGCVAFLRWRGYLAKVLSGVVAGIRTLWRTPHRVLFMLYTALLWLGYWLMTYLVCFALPSTAQLPLIASFLLLVVGTFGMIVPVQGGIGSYHMAIALWLQLEGIVPNDGLAYATLSHGAQMALVLLLTLGLFTGRTARMAMRRAHA